MGLAHVTIDAKVLAADQDMFQGAAVAYVVARKVDPATAVDLATGSIAWICTLPYVWTALTLCVFAEGLFEHVVTTAWVTALTVFVAPSLSVPALAVGRPAPHEGSTRPRIWPRRSSRAPRARPSPADGTTPYASSERTGAAP